MTRCTVAALSTALVALTLAGCGHGTAPATPDGGSASVVVGIVTGRTPDTPGSYTPGTDPLLAPLQRG